MNKQKVSAQWERVHGVGLHPWEEDRSKRNQQILKDQVFCETCNRAGIKPTRRQASKWNNGKGKAYKLARGTYNGGADRL